MTIGMVAYGNKAGLGIFKGLEAAEKISEGSIFGFAVFKAIVDKEEIIAYETQRGGTTTLITKGEKTGGLPPVRVQESKIAAVISSGPDRGIHLAKKIPGHPKIGLVSGHRHSGSLLPGLQKFVTEAVYSLMKKGMTASEAVGRIMNQYPAFDAGVVAVDIHGNIGCENSIIVNKRPDVMEVVREDKEAGCKVAVLLNEIYPKEAAIIAAAICMQIMTESRRIDLELTIKAGLQIELAGENFMVIDEKLDVVRIATTDNTILKGKRGGTVPNIQAKVLKEGKVIGHTISEPVVSLVDGIITGSLGKKEFKVPVRFI